MNTCKVLVSSRRRYLETIVSCYYLFVRWLLRPTMFPLMGTAEPVALQDQSLLQRDFWKGRGQLSGVVSIENREAK